MDNRAVFPVTRWGTKPATATTVHLSGPTTTRVITYTYDPLNRLTGADYSTGEWFEYTYDEANRLTSAGGVPYTWDDRGNLTNDGVFTYTYNSAGRMVQAESVTSTLVYTYNGDGVRLAMAVNDQVTTYAQDLADGLPQVLVESASQETTEYVYGRDRLGQAQNDNIEWFLEDALRSVRQVVDGVGNVLLSRTYGPYGQTLSESGTASSRYGYTGEQWDTHTGLVFLRARYYDPSTGQFLSKDPWVGSRSQPQSLHKYVYVASNPVNEIDPSGFCSQPGWNDSSGLYTEENCDRLA